MENIATIASNNDDFEILVQALEAADLVSAVADTPDLTVFAPTDAAFGQLAADLGFTGDTSDEDAVFAFIVGALTDLGGGDPIPLLTDILLYHVAPGAKTAAEVAATPSITTLLDGANISALGSELSDLEPDVANPSIVIEDIEASNGQIQAIDRVLLPLNLDGNAPAENIAEVAIANGNFNVLVQALEAADLVGAVTAEGADLTVFAPTDAAFGALATTLGFDGDTTDPDAVFSYIAGVLTDLGGGDPIPLLTDILLYHVSPGAKTFAEVASNVSAPTLLEGAVVAPNGAQLRDNDPEEVDPQIVIADVPASNGVIQAIDAVLLPINLDTGAPDENIAEVAIANGNFNVLVQALQAADLVGAVSAEDADLTVFAPTDAAFGKLAATLGFDGDLADPDAVFGFLVAALTDLGGGDPIPLLTNILLYHVAPGAQTFAQLTAGGPVTTLLDGAVVTPDGASLIDIDPDGENPQIIISDVPASNGVVQAIDAVLLPIDLDTANIVDASAPAGGIAFATQGDDIVFGGDGAEEIRAGAGDDVVSGEGGADIVRGAGGDDVVRGGEGDDLQFGGGGDDVVRGEAGDDELFGNAGSDQLFGDDGADILRGGAGADEMNGGSGDDNMRGGALDDLMNGGADNDVMRGGGGDDTMNGDDGDDRVFGGIGDDTVDGGAGRDVLFGNSGDDIVSGGDGDDIVNGGIGTDIMTGGSGADQFHFFHGFGDDTVTDYEDGVDILVLNFGIATSIDDLTIDQAGANAVVTLGDRSITLENTQATNLTEDDFQFV